MESPSLCNRAMSAIGATASLHAGIQLSTWAVTGDLLEPSLLIYNFRFAMFIAGSLLLLISLPLAAASMDVKPTSALSGLRTTALLLAGALPGAALSTIGGLSIASWALWTSGVNNERTVLGPAESAAVALIGLLCWFAPWIWLRGPGHKNPDA